MRKLIVLAAAAAVLSTSSPLQAGFAANYTGTGAGQGSPFAGQINFTRVSGDSVSWIAGSSGNSFSSFCIQLNQFTTPNPNNFTTVSLESAPVGNGTTTTSPMTSAQADQIRRLWFAVHSTLSTGTTAEKNLKNAAFQATIWEILDTGTLATAYTPPTDLQSQVTTWLALSLNTSYAMANLVALTSGQNQDQIVEIQSGYIFNGQGEVVAAPAPAGLVLAGLGLPLFAALRRFRKPAAADAPAA